MARLHNTSFKTYVLCDVCKINHNFHVKHLYSRCHKQRVKEILNKSVAKVSLAKDKGTAVEIHDEDWQKEEKFWCYFCSAEFQKHFLHNSVMVSCLGLINHLAGPEHYEAVKKFLKANRLNTDSAEKYILKKTELTRFLSHLPEAETQYLKKMEHLHLKDVAHIRTVEKQREELVEEVMLQATTASDSSDYHSQAMSSSIFQTVSEVASLSSGPPQASVDYKHPSWQSVNQRSWGSKNKVSLFDSDGRIPPWLQPDDDNPTPLQSAPVIGPTMDDLLKHVEKQRKKGLNPKRVGANFNHKAITSSSWLPSFGRVWNQGRRKQSRFQYESEKRKKY